MRRAILRLLLVLSAVAGARAQIRSVEMMTPRPFGYFLGDIIKSEVDITVEPGFTLNRASVPKAGQLNYWLELVGTKTESASRGKTTLYRLYLTYQNFYAALDSRRLEIPGFSLSFVSGDQTAVAIVPPLSIEVSALREVQPAMRESGTDYMRPDVRPKRIDLRADRARTLGLGFAALIVLGFLAYDRAWPPFTARPHRPFTLAAREIHRLLRGSAPGPAYKEALLILHRAIDESAGRTILSGDLESFLKSRPAFCGLETDFKRFFSSSHRVFFGDQLLSGTPDFSQADLLTFCDGLAQAERSA
jgi:mxaA protein